MEGFKTKNLLLLLVCLLVLSSSITFGIEETGASTIYVDDDNVTGPWDGSYEHPFQFIQDGINESDNGDTVFVLNGMYYECLKISKEISLIGEDNINTILQQYKPEELYQFDTILSVHSDNVQIKNLCIRPYNNITMYITRPIHATDSKGLIIQNNHFVNCNSGIIIDTNSSAEILDNHIQSFSGIPSRCIYFNNPAQDSTIIISRNSIIRYGIGINFNFYETAPLHIKIDHNHMESPFGQDSSASFDCGISFSHELDTNYHLNISHNTITGFTFGIYYSGSGLPVDNSSIQITQNSFNNEITDFYLLPDPKRSNEPFVVTNNNFYGENKDELFINEILLDPVMIPFLINHKMGLIHKNSIQWSSNYWHRHNTVLPKIIPGKMLIFLKVPFLAIQYPIFQIDSSPVNTPYIIQ